MKKNYKEIIIKTLPFVEKYRPKELTDVISHSMITNTLQNFITNKTFPHLLLYGPPGTGKTSIILAAARQLYGKDFDVMVKMLNASEERKIDAIRDTIIPFAATGNLLFSDSKMFKLIILDEADAITQEAQAILRQVIEKYTRNVRFCLICNYIEKINIALQSRCVRFRFAPLKREFIKERLISISKLENININSEACDVLIERSNGDMRKVLNTLQSIAHYEEIKEESVNDILGYPCDREIKMLYESLINDSLSESLYLYDDLEKEKGYLLNNIITEIHALILQDINNNDKLNKKNVLKVLQNLSKIEFYTATCINSNLQTSAFVSIFKLYPIRLE
jgi:replication factor C subunit 3/5